MDNFFSAKVKEKTTQRINKLTPNTKPLWGKMNVNQMICHLSDVTKVALGHKKANPEGKFYHRTQLAIFLALYVVSWGKEKQVATAPTNQEKEGTPIKEFNADKKELIDLLNRFYNAKDDSFQTHARFGKLSNWQWGRMIAKHTDHHLRQFGV